jgi:cytoskeletal protein CcmA (bactofilin family)
MGKLRYSLWQRVLLALVAAVLLISFTAAPAVAADMRSGSNIVVSKGDVIDDDLYVAAGTVVIDGIINGDLFAAGGLVTVNGTINGGIIAAAGTVIINGAVTRSVRAAAGAIRISGEISGDAMLFGNNLEMSDAAVVNGDVLLGMGDASLGGTMKGNLKGAAGVVIISGTIKGNLDLNLNELVLLPSARVEGEMRYTCEEEAYIHPGARVKGNITHKLPEPVEKEMAQFTSVASTVRNKVISFLMAFVLGVVTIFIAQRRTQSVARQVRTRPLLSLGWGALLLVAVPVAIVVVGITIIGIPLALITLALYLLALYLSQLALGLVIGQWIMGLFNRTTETKAAMMGALAAGLAILIALRSIPIPYLGMGIWGFTFLWGLGSLLLSGVELRSVRAESSEDTAVEGDDESSS